MKKTFLKFIIFSAVLPVFTACSHSSSDVNNKNQTQARQQYEMQKRQQQAIAAQKQRQMLEEQKERNWIVQQKNAEAKQQTPPIPFHPSAAQTASEPVAQPVETAASASTAREFNESAEHKLYAKVIESYRQNRSADLLKATELLQKTYPQSIFSDRAIFLGARLSAEHSEYDKALVQLDRLIHFYPHGSKVVSAYFLRGQVLKKLGRPAEARAAWSEVQSYFPGSPEAYRVPLELKLMTMQAKATM